MEQTAYNELNAEDVAALVAAGDLGPDEARQLEAARDGDDRKTVLDAAAKAEAAAGDPSTELGYRDLTIEQITEALDNDAITLERIHELEGGREERRAGVDELLTARGFEAPPAEPDETRDGIDDEVTLARRGRREPRTEIAQPAGEGLPFDDGNDPDADAVNLRRPRNDVGIPTIDKRLVDDRKATLRRERKGAPGPGIAGATGDDARPAVVTIDPELVRIREATAAREAELADRSITAPPLARP
jgi:hypothetical protein